MSLDVYLRNDVKFTRMNYQSGIFIRRDGQTVEISQAEWDSLHKGHEPARMKLMEIETDELWHANITHNCVKIASNVSYEFYRAVWGPEELQITKAGQLMVLLEEGIKELKDKPGHYRQYGDKSGWGTYDQFVPWLERYLEACKKFPDARVEVSR